jgi:hypothetical protein
MYELSRIVCDPSQPQAIETFNECLRRAGKPQIAFPANNKKASGSGGDLGGLDLVRWALEPDENGLPKLIFLEGSLVHPPDPELVMASRPTCTEEEIPSYVLDRDATGEFIKDQTDKRCQDDGCDDLRYACTSIFLEPVPEPKPRVQKVDPWTNAAMFGTPASLAREANRRARQKDW